MHYFSAIPRHSRSLRCIAAAFMLAHTVLFLTSCKPAPAKKFPEYEVNVTGHSGSLLVSLFNDPGTNDYNSSIHNSVFVNNRYHNVMEENDIRGFLDGNFIYGWNQPGQVHVRVGRRGKSAKYGEYELFRITYRWKPLPLPENSTVLDSRMRIFVEKPAKYPVTLYLYKINKNWNPGKGGILKNNLSPPANGEVWWNDVAYNQQGWGLPGANLASDTNHEADTPAMPLAEAQYNPGDEYIEFSSPKLNNYINEQISARSPLLFLLKLSDYQEDIRDTRITLYSGNTGDNRNTSRRPVLYIDWQAMGVAAEHKYDFNIEYGRSYTFPKIDTIGKHVIAASLTESLNPLRPDLEFRSGHNDIASGWEEMAVPLSVDVEWVQFRLRSAHDPVILGQPFAAEFKDTWVLTGPPEEQHVPWDFISPAGEKYTVTADYNGDFNWSVSFVPDELGQWKYYWENNFSDGYQSDIGIFDVIIGDRDNAFRQLKSFKEQLAALDVDAPERHEIHMHRFATLERAAIRFLDPATFNAAEGQEIRRLLNDIRGILDEKPPEKLAPEPGKPFEWQKPAYK